MLFPGGLLPLRIFEVLYLRVQESIGKDQVYMSFAAVDQALTPMSNPTYDRGMRELIEKGFIAATPMQGIYWLNPSFVWNGDRLAFVKEYRRAAAPGKVKGPARDPNTVDLFDGVPDCERPAETPSSEGR